LKVKLRTVARIKQINYSSHTNRDEYSNKKVTHKKKFIDEKENFIKTKLKLN